MAFLVEFLIRIGDIGDSALVYTIKNLSFYLSFHWSYDMGIFIL
jgi:hypothetical protein